MLHETLMCEAQALEQSCIAHRRNLHARAETGFDLKETFDYVWKTLSEMGLSPQKCGRSGISCTLGNPGKTFLLRADMDALPVQEETGHSFACTDGNMHACGHDMHTAMLLTAAQLLKKHENELPGTIKLMFQPAEEPLEGARDMIENGILENPHVNAALMFHVMTNHAIPAGTVLVSAPGMSAPAAGMFTIRIQGKGSHGAMPHTGVDPVNAAAHIIIALQEINARELALSDSAALTIGMVQAGNTANVIPDTALLRGSFRAFGDDISRHIRSRIEEISTGVAAVFRARAEVSFEGSCPTLVNDASLCADAEKYAAELLGGERVFSAAKLAASSASRSSGSEDFASVSHRVPSVMLALAAGSPEDGFGYPLHHPRADFDERALIPGSAAYAYIAMRWLEENRLQ